MTRPPILRSGDPHLHPWILPGLHRTLVLRRGSIGFLLAHQAMRINQNVEKLALDAGVDEGGWNPRKIAGTSTWSRHAYGEAMDLNWARHPSGVPAVRSFTSAQIRRIHRDLDFYDGLLEWGGDWPSRPGSHTPPDPMHWQFREDATVVDAERRARELLNSKWGAALLKVNPGQKKVILT